MSDTEIQFKWTGQDELKGYLATAYVTTVRISNMPYKYCWDGNLLRFGTASEASAVSREKLPNDLTKYFTNHDFINYDVCDLWWEIGANNLISFC